MPPPSPRPASSSPRARRPRRRRPARNSAPSVVSTRFGTFQRFARHDVMTTTRFFIDATGETRAIRVDDSTVRDSEMTPPLLEGGAARTGRSDRVESRRVARLARLARASATTATTVNASRKFRFIWFPHRERRGWTGERNGSMRTNRIDRWISTTRGRGREGGRRIRTIRPRPRVSRCAADDDDADARSRRRDAMRKDYYARRDRSSS